MRIALLSNITLDPLEYFLREDFEYIYRTGSNRYMQELADNGSLLNNGSFDVVLVHLDGSELLRKYLYRIVKFGDIKPELEVTARFFFSAVERYATGNRGTIVILNTVCFPPDTINTFLERNSEYSFHQIKDWFNEELSRLSRSNSNILVMDWEKVVATYGYDNLYDERFWYLGGIKYNSFAFERLSRELRGLMKAYKGMTRKVIVVDIDNTLWGGVIGEDGIEGIQLSEDGTGKAFVDFQNVLKGAKESGLIFALCSKNNLDDVREAFETHRMMRLSMDDFVSVKVNWNDKVTNMREIALELNVGLEAFVFLDDNPAEREFVRHHLPEIAVPEFPAEPAELVRWFVRDVLSVYFPRVFLTNEDKRRTDQYRANAERKKFAETPDMTDFIKDLHIRLKVYVNDKALLERTAQMTQKTNQFNLTTRRYGRNEVECFMNSPDWYVFNLEYEDKFGGEGIIAVGIIKVMHGSALIDSFLMSCRVIGRGIEYTFLDTITKSVREKHPDIVEILAEYVPTKKNGIASDFYEKAGFNVQGRETDGRKRYSRDLPADLPSRAVGD